MPIENLNPESEERAESRRRGHIRSGWRVESMLARGPLTDKKIAKYEKEGWYSAAFKEARRGLMARKAARREGNFLKRPDGTLVFSPR